MQPELATTLVDASDDDEGALLDELDRDCELLFEEICELVGRNLARSTFLIDGEWDADKLIRAKTAALSSSTAAVALTEGVSDDTAASQEAAKREAQKEEAKRLENMQRELAEHVSLYQDGWSLARARGSTQPDRYWYHSNSAVKWFHTTEEREEKKTERESKRRKVEATAVAAAGPCGSATAKTCLAGYNSTGCSAPRPSKDDCWIEGEREVEAGGSIDNAAWPAPPPAAWQPDQVLQLLLHQPGIRTKGTASSLQTRSGLDFLDGLAATIRASAAGHARFAQGHS